VKKGSRWSQNRAMKPSPATMRLAETKVINGNDFVYPRKVNVRESVVSIISSNYCRVLLLLSTARVRIGILSRHWSCDG
jgi:hypothetical protein